MLRLEEEEVLVFVNPLVHLQRKAAFSGSLSFRGSERI
jgi:hypothetical protein